MGTKIDSKTRNLICLWGMAASYLLALGCMAMGFYKMYFYRVSVFVKSINCYVGGDAYNYVINANYAGAWFVLAVLFVIVGLTILIYKCFVEYMEKVRGL